ncbi:MAG: hypothetical protein ACOX2F_03570 [bacterium]
MKKLLILLPVLLLFSCTTSDEYEEDDSSQGTVLDKEASDDVLSNDDVVLDNSIVPDKDVVPDDKNEDDDDSGNTGETNNDDDSGNTGETNGDDDSNLNTGDTSGNQALAGKPGAGCTKDEDCTNWTGENEQYAICLAPAEGYPDGYCSFMCDGSVNMNYGCNGNGGVYYGYGSWGDGYCFHPCSDPTDCRVGYRCSQTVKACMPDCEKNKCSLGVCDSNEKVCLDK